MTDAKAHDVRDDPGNDPISGYPLELPDARPGRAAQIAAIHMLADWFAEHPEIPMPTSIMCNLIDDRAPDSTEDERVAGLEHFARINEWPAVHHGQSFAQATLEIADARIHGLRISYTRSVELDAYARKVGA